MVDDLFMMELKNAGVEDSGQYSITASNEHGTVRASVTVQVGADGKLKKSSREEAAEVLEAKKSFTEETSSIVTHQKQTFESDISIDSSETSFRQEDVSVEAVVGGTGETYTTTEVYTAGKLVGPKEEEAPSEKPRDDVDVKKVSRTRQQSDLDSEDTSKVIKQEVSEEKTVTTRTTTEEEEEIDVTTKRKTKQESTVVEESSLEKKGEKPTMPIKPDSVSVSEGETIVLKCRVKG